MPSSSSGSTALGSNSAYRGLRSSEAAERLSHCLRGVLADDSRRIELEEAREFGDVLFRQVTTTHNLIMLISALLLFAGYAYGADATSSAMDSSYLISGLVVISGVALNITLVFMRLHRLRWEVHYRMTDVLLEYERVALSGGAVMASAVYASATALAFAKAAEPDDHNSLPSLISSAQVLSAAAASAGAVVTGDGVVAGIMHSSWESLEFHEPINATHALPVFRDGDWIRLPVSLLVKGDLIALTTKEIPPAKFDERDGRLLGRRGSSLRSYLESPSGLFPHSVTPKSGGPEASQSTSPSTSSELLSAAESRSSSIMDDTKNRIRENDIDAVTLVGDLRRYVLRDTVARAALQRRLRVQPKPQPLLMWELRSFSRLASMWQIGLVSISILAIIIRSLVTNCVPDSDLSNRNGSTNCRDGGFIGLLAGLLYQIPALLLCLSPVSLPLVLLIVEAYSTARILAFHEAVLVRNKWKEWKKRLMLDIFYAQRKQNLESATMQERSSEMNRSSSSSSSSSNGRINSSEGIISEQQGRGGSGDRADKGLSPRSSQQTRFLCCSCFQKSFSGFSLNFFLRSLPNSTTTIDSDVSKNRPLESSEEDSASMFITEGDATGNNSNAPTPRARRQLPPESLSEAQKSGPISLSEKTQAGSEIRRGAELWALLAGGNLNAQLFAANSDSGSNNPAPLPFWNNNDGSDSDDSSSDGSDIDESDDPFVSSKRGKSQNHDRLASDMWMPEKKKGTSLNRLLRVLQKGPVFNEAQGHSNALAELRQIRPDVGQLDSRGEIIPIQYLGSSANSVPGPDGSPISVVSQSQGTSSLSETDPLAIAHKASSASRRKFDGPMFSHISKRSWKDVRASRILFYLQRILRAQGQSVVQPSPIPARHSSVSTTGLIERLIGSIHACFQRCCSRSVSAEEATLQRWKNSILKDDLIDVGFGLRPVQTPLLSSQLMARLGVITTFCCSDKNTVCESEPTVENVMLLKGQTGSVFIDLHADETSPTGIRFDDKNWKNHIAALKPVGLACLVNARQADSETVASGAWKSTSATTKDADLENSNVQNSQTENVLVETETNLKPLLAEVKSLKDQEVHVATEVIATLSDSVDVVPKSSRERRSRRLHTRRQLAVSGESVRPESPSGDTTTSNKGQRASRQSRVKSLKSRKSQQRRKHSDDLSGSGTDLSSSRNRGGSFVEEQRRSRKKRLDSKTSHEDMMTRKNHSRARSASGSEASSDKSYMQRVQSSPSRRLRSDGAREREDDNDDDDDGQSVHSDYSMGRNEAVDGTPTVDMRRSFRRLSRELSRDNEDSGFGSGFDDSDSSEDSDIDDTESGNRSRNMSMDGGTSEDGKERSVNPRHNRRLHTKGAMGGRESASSSRLGSSQNRSATVSVHSSEVDSDHFGEEEGFSDRDDKSAGRVSDDRRNDIRNPENNYDDTSPTHTGQSGEKNKDSPENEEIDEDGEAEDLDDDEECEDFDDDDDDNEEEDDEEDDDEDEDDEDLDDEEDEDEYGDDFVVARSHHRRKVRLDVVKEEDNIEDSENEDDIDDGDEEDDEEEEEEEEEEGEEEEQDDEAEKRADSEKKPLKINQLRRSNSVPDNLVSKKITTGDHGPSRTPRVFSDLDQVQSESKSSLDSKLPVRKDDAAGPGSSTGSAPSMNLSFTIANAIRMPNLPSLASLGSLAFQPARFSSPEGQRNSETTTLNASATGPLSVVSLIPNTSQGLVKSGAQLVQSRTVKSNIVPPSLQNLSRQQQLQRQQTLLLEQQNFLRRQRVVLALQQQILQRRIKSGANVGSGKKIDVNKLLVILSKELAIDDDRSLHKLAQAVKRVPPRSYLCSLAREIGFTEYDVSQFQHVRHIHTIGVSSLPARPPGHPAALGVPHRGPRVKPVRTIAHALQPAISATVVRDIRRNTLETLTQGNVPYLLSNCDMYWDGKDVLSFSKGRREALLSTFQQWQSEDLVCVGLAFDPVSREEGEVLRLIDAAYVQSTLSRAHSPELIQNNSMFQPVDIGLGFDAANLFLMARDLKLNAQMDARKPSPSPQAQGSFEISPSAISNITDEPIVDALSPVSPTGGVSESAAKKLAQMCEAKLLRMQSSQIFVGMVAARYLPQPKMQTLIKDLDGAGVRFTYMANRNYRQTKPLATKMGLETGWNCAISLMPRKQRRNRLIDGGQLSSSHAVAVESAAGVGGGEEAAGAGGQGGLGDFEIEDEDELEFGVEGILTEEQRKRRIRGEIDEQRWDMKAQLPHGIPEIRTHLKEKDNVPLLVSLFTDSTPASIAGMIRIMQENGEQVLVVCSSLRKSTPLLFNVADLGVAIEPPFDGLQRDSNSDRKGVNVKTVRLSEIADAAGLEKSGHLEEGSTNSRSREREKALPLNPQHPNLRFSSAFTSLHASLSLPAGASLHLLLKTITESRRILEEARQTLLFLSTSQLLLALLIVVNVCTAMPQILPIHHLLWLSWVVIPLVALTLLAAPPNDVVKHGSKESPDSTSGDLISMPEKRPLTTKAKDGTFHVWDILPGPEAPSLTEQEAAHYASQGSGIQSDLGGESGESGAFVEPTNIATEVEISVLPRGDEVTDSISSEQVHVQVHVQVGSDAGFADLQENLAIIEDREEMLAVASERDGDQTLSRADGSIKSEGLTFNEGVHSIEGFDELFLNDNEPRNDDNVLQVGDGDEESEALRSESNERRRIESISKQDSADGGSGGTGDDEVLLPVIFSADEEGGDDDVKHQLRLRSVEEGLRMEENADDGVPSAAELELVLGLDKDTLSPSTLAQGLLFASPGGFLSSNGQENDVDNVSNQPQSDVNADTDAHNDLAELGIIDSDTRVDVVEEENNENVISSPATADEVGLVDSALDQRVETVIPVVDSDGVVLDAISGGGGKVRPGKSRVPRSVAKGPVKAGKRTQKGAVGTAQSQISATISSSSSASSSSSSSSLNAIPGFDAKTGGVRAEALIKYAAYNDVTSILSGNILDLTDVSAKHAAVRLKNRGAQIGGALTAADAAAELDFAMGIPPVQGLVASTPPPTPLPKSWKTLTLYAALSLLPAACIHEYLFERSMAVCFQLQDEGWKSDRNSGGGYPLFFPSHLIPSKISVVKSCIASAQSFVLLSLVIWFVISSSLFAHRALSWQIANPLKNKAWIVGCTLVIVLQLIHCHILTAVEGASSIFSTQPWDLWIVGLGFQGVSFCILWMIRRHDAKQLQRERKMSRLLFDTRLGMYSPR